MLNSLPRRLWLLSVLLLLACLLALGARPQQRMAEQSTGFSLEEVIPKRFGDWVMDERPGLQVVNPQVNAAIRDIYQQVLSRHYINRRDGRVMMLSIAYGADQSYGNDLHVPDVCYPAGGFQILQRQDASLQLDSGHQLPTRRLIAQRNQRREPLTYWVVVGDKAVTGAVNAKLTGLSYGLRGVIPDGLIIRISSVGMGDEQAFAGQEAFTRELLDSLAPRWKSKLSGA